jgi:hypothetical protein
MKEEPKSNAKKLIEEHRGYLLLFAFFAVIAFCIIFIVGMTSSIPHSIGRTFFCGFLYAVCLALAGVLLIAFFRWVYCWRNFKRFLFGCACFATLLALFYLEEDWRGKHDWNAYKREWEAKGQKFDWDAYVPTPVPDDQNFAMSPVWIARVKYNMNDPEKVKTWYGDRGDSDDVSKFYALCPVTDAALVGTNWAYHLPTTPDLPVRWTAARMLDLKPWQSFYRNLEKTNSSAEISITPQPQSPAADVLLALSKFDPAIERLQADSQLPYSRFPVQYDIDDPGAILIPHLAGLKNFAQVLELRAIAELQIGQTDKAFDDIKLMLRFSDSVQSEPFIITHLVRMAVLQMTIQCIYEGLSEHKWSDAQLAGLDSELSKINYPADYQNSIHSETAGHVKLQEWIEQKRSHGREFMELIASYNGIPNSTVRLVGTAFHLVPAGWFYQGDILLSESDQAWSSVPAGDAQRTISPQAVLQASNTIAGVFNHLSPFNFIGRFLAPELGTYAKRTAFAQESVDLTRTAIALERYYLAIGQYPATLDALVPKYLQEIPADIINGEPLHYRPTPDGRFVLYSVGWNEKDDGGVAIASKGSIGTGINIDQGDWVWQCPKE